ncbi:MAG: DNA primase [Trueperaceae bacterium]|nr:DNA primase [Trueperaceae bacterium]
MDAKEQIRTKLDLVDVVGEMVALKPAGRERYKGLCPFHDEKTPSFHVLRDKGFYYCFGCQAKGDLFDFVMQTQGMEFAEALQMLGDRAGIEVTTYAAGPQSKKKRDLYDVNTVALSFFRDHLDDQNGLARNYLLGRGLSAESIDTFALGYAPEGWDNLLRHALHKGVSESDLLAAGLIAESESGRRYDRFRNRIIFPINDHLGRTVGFSGRVLDDSLPKYLNTPETDIFDKSTILYGLAHARTTIRDSHECIVVEGYTDVIALHQTGFPNAVAALGATLTEEQAGQLSRLDVNTLYLAFDADAAGQRAVLSGLEHSLGRQFLVKAVRVPFGKDPADAVLGGHTDAFRRALADGLSEVTFRFNNVLDKHDAATHEGKKEILEELLPVLKPRDVFDPVASEMRRLVVDHLHIDGARLDDWLGRRGRQRLNKTQVQGLTSGQKPQPSHLTLIELEVMALLLTEPGLLRERVERLEPHLPTTPNGSLLKEFFDFCAACDYSDHDILRHYRARDDASVLFERLFAQQSDDASERTFDIDGHLQKSLSRLRELYLENDRSVQREKLMARMEEVSRYLTDPNLPTDQLQRYYAELKEIHQLLAARDAERRNRIMPSKTPNRRR